jgi:uncharacterized protein
MNLPVVTYTVLYNNKNITTDIGNDVISIDYTDKIKGESDELSITLNDAEGKWKGPWYPEKGATLELQIEQDGSVLNAGVFKIDEIAASGSTSGDVVTIKALAASITQKLRTAQTYAHENKTLREIATTIAAALGLTVLGTIKDIRIGRQHQYRETALQFLNRIGSLYGYIFSVRGGQLIFTYYEDIENRTPSLTYNKSDLTGYDFKDTTAKVYRLAQVKHHSSKKKKVVQHISVENKQIYTTVKNDDLELRVRAENEQQAEAIAKYALYKHNSKSQEGNISGPGNILFLSGNCCNINGFGAFDGRWHIQQSQHSINRDGGYTISGSVKKVGV